MEKKTCKKQVKKQVNNSIKGLCCLSVWARVAGISYRGQPCGLCWFSVGKSAMGPMTMGLGFSLGWHISVARRIHGVTGPGWARGGGGQPLTSLLHVVFVRKAVPASNSYLHLSWQAVSAKKIDFNNLWHNCPAGKTMKKKTRKTQNDEKCFFIVLGPKCF